LYTVKNFQQIDLVSVFFFINGRSVGLNGNRQELKQVIPRINLNAVGLYRQNNNTRIDSVTSIANKKGHHASDNSIAGNAVPVVGIGASAGGLEALEKFFTNLFPHTGFAFIVVTHQQPGHISLTTPSHRHAKPLARANQANQRRRRQTSSLAAPHPAHLTDDHSISAVLTGDVGQSADRGFASDG